MRASFPASGGALLALALVLFAGAAGACSTFDDLAADDDDTNGGAAGSVRPADGKKNGSETDVDCGGEGSPKCDDGKRCENGTDCASGSCVSGTCKPPAPDDGVKNGDETDVDCGGVGAPKCGAGKGCNTNEDCATDGCSYDKKCVAARARSCTGHFGGDTCGAGDSGAAGAVHESCCTTVANARGLQIGKYLVTAGRMRAFVERFGGNLQQWASTNPPGWDSRLTSQLPKSPQEADFVLGPNNKRGCSVPGRGGRTYWQQNVPAEEQSDFSKDVLDEKALNCVPWFMAAAICAYDGGRLPTHAENVALMTNDGRNRWPWEPRDTRSYSSSQQDDRLVHRRSYATPNVANFRMDGTEPLDRSFWVAPPGRRPTGANAIGVQDAVGDLLVWTSTQRQISWTMSWEDHVRQSNDQPSLWPSSGSEEAYYAIGARCVFDR